VNDKQKMSDIFDPEGCEKYPAITAVEIYLGGVGRLMFPDGTVQFADNETYPDVVYSPRMTEDNLEVFCKVNITHYEKYHEKHGDLFGQGDHDKAPPIQIFWS